MEITSFFVSFIVKMWISFEFAQKFAGLRTLSSKLMDSAKPMSKGPLHLHLFGWYLDAGAFILRVWLNKDFVLEEIKWYLTHILAPPSCENSNVAPAVQCMAFCNPFYFCSTSVLLLFSWTGRCYWRYHDRRIQIQFPKTWNLYLRTLSVLSLQLWHLEGHYFTELGNFYIKGKEQNNNWLIYCPYIKLKFLKDLGRLPQHLGNWYFFNGHKLKSVTAKLWSPFRMTLFWIELLLQTVIFSKNVNLFAGVTFYLSILKMEPKSTFRHLACAKF